MPRIPLLQRKDQGTGLLSHDRLPRKSSAWVLCDPAAQRTQSDWLRPNQGAVGTTRPGHEEERSNSLLRLGLSRLCDWRSLAGCLADQTLRIAWLPDVRLAVLCQEHGSLWGKSGSAARGAKLQGNCRQSAVSAEVLRLTCRQIIRSIYSSPSRHGATIAATILNNHELFTEWERELREVVAFRIK